MLFHIPLYAKLNGVRTQIGIATVEDDEVSGDVSHPGAIQMFQTSKPDDYAISVAVDGETGTPIEADVVAGEPATPLTE